MQSSWVAAWARRCQAGGAGSREAPRPPSAAPAGNGNGRTPGPAGPLPPPGPPKGDAGRCEALLRQAARHGACQ